MMVQRVITIRLQHNRSRKERHNGIDQDDALRGTDPPARPGDNHHHDPPSGRNAFEFPLWGSLIHYAPHHHLYRIRPHPARLDRWGGRTLPKEVKLCSSMPWGGPQATDHVGKVSNMV